MRGSHYLITATTPGQALDLAGAFAGAGIPIIKPVKAGGIAFVVEGTPQSVESVVGQSGAGYQLDEKAPD